jgi:hypothetical protein
MTSAQIAEAQKLAQDRDRRGSGKADLARAGLRIARQDEYSGSTSSSASKRATWRAWAPVVRVAWSASVLADGGPG